jgi:hypothetical protein
MPRVFYEEVVTTMVDPSSSSLPLQSPSNQEEEEVDIALLIRSSSNPVLRDMDLEKYLNCVCLLSTVYTIEKPYSKQEIMDLKCDVVRHFLGNMYDTALYRKCMDAIRNYQRLHILLCNDIQECVNMATEYKEVMDREWETTWKNIKVCIPDADNYVCDPRFNESNAEIYKRFNERDESIFYVTSQIPCQRRKE